VSFLLARRSKHHKLTLFIDQAIRNYSDLLSLAVPEKYRQLGGFYKSAVSSLATSTLEADRTLLYDVTDTTLVR
jgi:hypothetical protein